jgi:hypothetical protein
MKAKGQQRVQDRQAHGRWRALFLLAISLVLSMTTWFSATAVIPQLRGEWNLSESAAAWMTIAVQIGFVCGALVSSLLNLSDVVSPRYMILGDRGGGRQRPAGSRGRRGHRDLAALRDGVLPCGRLSTRPQADVHMVPERQGYGARHPRRCADRGIGDASPRQRTRRAGLAHGNLRDLRPDPGRRSDLRVRRG